MMFFLGKKIYIKMYNTFITQISADKDGDKVYVCPSCGSVSGISAVLKPAETYYFHHYKDCPNKGKVPIEPPLPYPTSDKLGSTCQTSYQTCK